MRWRVVSEGLWTLPTGDSCKEVDDKKSVAFQLVVLFCFVLFNSHKCKKPPLLLKTLLSFWVWCWDLNSVQVAHYPKRLLLVSISWHESFQIVFLIIEKRQTLNAEMPLLSMTARWLECFPWKFGVWPSSRVEFPEGTVKHNHPVTKDQLLWPQNCCCTEFLEQDVKAESLLLNTFI